MLRRGVWPAGVVLPGGAGRGVQGAGEARVEVVGGTADQPARGSSGLAGLRPFG